MKKRSDYRDDGQVAAAPGAGSDLEDAAAAAIDLDEEINAALDALDDEQYEHVAPRGPTEAEIGTTDEAAAGPAAEAEEVEPEAIAGAGRDEEDETAGDAELAALFSEAASDDLDDNEQRLATGRLECRGNRRRSRRPRRLRRR